MPNVNVNFNFGIQAVDTVAAVSVFNRAVSSFQLQATSWQACDWLQVSSGAPTTVTLPASPIYFLYARNLGSNNVTMSYTPNGGSSTSVILLPIGSNVGGTFFYVNSAESVGAGITALSFLATTATTPVEYFVSA